GRVHSMPYELHIERVEEEGGISLDEWLKAIAGTEGVRLVRATEHTIINPRTGQRISVPASEGDAEVFFPKIGGWLAVFSWRRGSVAFNVGNEPLDANNPAFLAATALATRLGATIRGDG